MPLSNSAVGSEWEIPAPESDGVIRLCEIYADDPDVLELTDDSTLYRDLVFAIGRQYSPSEKHTPWRHVLPYLLPRLRTGWFADPTLRSPQARYGQSDLFPSVAIVDPADSASIYARKPQGAVWTSSFLPGGESGWHYGEQGEFARLGRTCYRLEFDETTTRSYAIDSLRDYENLLEQFPVAYDDGSIGVRWIEAAKVFDAVRLTARGLLVADNVACRTVHGVGRLEGWGAESTAWLNEPPNYTMTPYDGDSVR